MTNDQLYDAAIEAIDALFCDLKVSRDKARENFKELSEHITLLLDSLKGNDDDR